MIVEKRNPAHESPDVRFGYALREIDDMISRINCTEEGRRRRLMAGLNDEIPTEEEKRAALAEVKDAFSAWITWAETELG